MESKDTLLWQTYISDLEEVFILVEKVHVWISKAEENLIVLQLALSVSFLIYQLQPLKINQPNLSIIQINQTDLQLSYSTQMLIPQFKITQDDDFIIISLRLPYVKVTACEFYIDQKLFKFYLKPYLLSLSFQQSLKPSQQPAKAVYNHDKHILTVYLEKLTKKEFFQNLNLLSNILQNKKTEKKEEKKKVLIEVMNEQGQKVVETEQHELTKNQYGYGFCGNYYNIFKNLQEEAAQLFAFDPKDVSINQRFELQEKITYEQFDQNSYMYDKLSNFDQIDRIVESQQAHNSLIKLMKQFSGVNEPLDYEKFKSQLKIPNKELLISKGDHQHIWKQLFTIVFNYLYELICMEGQLGVESAKTINKTSPVLAANVLFREESLEKAIYATCRRCLTYSLYRHLDICQKVLDMMSKQLNLQLCIAIVSDLRFLFEKSDSDPRYLLNTIFLNDYCVYLMSGPAEQKEQHIKQLLKQIKGLKLVQSELELDVEEEAMESVLDGENIEESQNTKVTPSDDLEKLLDLD